MICIDTIWLALGAADLRAGIDSLLAQVVRGFAQGPQAHHFLRLYPDDGQVPIDNNVAKNAVGPLVAGRKKWLFVGSQQAGERAAVVMSLIESAKLYGHDPWAYLTDV